MSIQKLSHTHKLIEDMNFANFDFCFLMATMTELQQKGRQKKPIYSLLILVIEH